MTEREERIPNYIDYPYDVFIKLRLEFLLICQDEIEAKVMRIIEKAIEDKRKNLYRILVNKTPKGEEVQLPEQIWVAISHTFFLDRLYGTVQSLNTLKAALKSLIDKKLILKSEGGNGPYDALEYTLNKPLIKEKLADLPLLDELNVMTMMKQPRKPRKSRKVVETEGQKLTPSNFDTLENEEEGQTLIPQSINNCPPRGSNFDTKEGQKLTPKPRDIDYYLDDTQKEENAHVSDDNAPTPSLSLSDELQSAVDFLNQDTQGYHIKFITHTGSEPLFEIQYPDGHVVFDTPPTILRAYAYMSSIPPFVDASNSSSSLQETIEESTPAPSDEQESKQESAVSHSQKNEEMPSSGRGKRSSSGGGARTRRTKKTEFVVPDELRPRVDAFYGFIDTWIQGKMGDPEEGYEHTPEGNAAICDLLTGKKPPTHNRFKKMLDEMWDEPKNAKTGWHTRAHMGEVPFLCKEYKSRRLAVAATERKETSTKSTLETATALAASAGYRNQTWDDDDDDLEYLTPVSKKQGA